MRCRLHTYREMFILSASRVLPLEEMLCLTSRQALIDRLIHFYKMVLAMLDVILARGSKSSALHILHNNGLLATDPACSACGAARCGSMLSRRHGVVMFGSVLALGSTCKHNVCCTLLFFAAFSTGREAKSRQNSTPNIKCSNMN